MKTPPACARILIVMQTLATEHKYSLSVSGFVEGPRLYLYGVEAHRQCGIA